MDMWERIGYMEINVGMGLMRILWKPAMNQWALKKKMKTAMVGASEMIGIDWLAKWKRVNGE